MSHSKPFQIVTSTVEMVTWSHNSNLAVDTVHQSTPLVIVISQRDRFRKLLVMDYLHQWFPTFNLRCITQLSSRLSRGPSCANSKK